jgi:hypothetical protein
MFVIVCEERAREEYKAGRLTKTLNFQFHEMLSTIILQLLPAAHHRAASAESAKDAAKDRTACSHMLKRATSDMAGAGFSSDIISASLERVKLLQNSVCDNLSIPKICSSTRLSALSGGSWRSASAAWQLRSLRSIPTQHLQKRQCRRQMRARCSEFSHERLRRLRLAAGRPHHKRFAKQRRKQHEHTGSEARQSIGYANEETAAIGRASKPDSARVQERICALDCTFRALAGHALAARVQHDERVKRGTTFCNKLP